jgi:hypothetical protein
MTKKMCRNDEIILIWVLFLIRNAFEKKELSLKGAYLLGCRDWSLGSSPSGTTLTVGQLGQHCYHNR